MLADDNEELYKELGIDRDTYLSILLESARQYFKAWPWHINARRHAYILMTERAIYVEQRLRGDGTREYKRYTERLSRLLEWDRDEILTQDRWRCAQLVKFQKEFPQHPLVQKMEEMKRRAPSLGVSLGMTDWPHTLAFEIKDNEPTFPNYGIYIYYHPYEGYKIGKAENIQRRMEKHYCSAPSSELLHVIETSDLNWCEAFLHGKYQRQRRHSNHEYFDLSWSDLEWMFSVNVLEPPRSIGDQLSLLDLL